MQQETPAQTTSEGTAGPEAVETEDTNPTDSVMAEAGTDVPVQVAHNLYLLLDVCTGIVLERQAFPWCSLTQYCTSCADHVCKSSTAAVGGNCQR